MKTIVSLFIASISLLLTAVPANAVPITISVAPTASGYANDGGPGTAPDGTFDTLNGPGAVNIEIAQSQFAGLGRGLMEFGLPVIPATSTILSATLDLQGFTGTAVGIPFELFSYDADGTISLSDATAPATLISLFTYAVPGISVFSFDVTSFITSSLGSSTHVGFRGQLQTEGAGWNEGRWVGPTRVADLGTRSTGSSREPVLTISYTTATVPEPTTLALMSLGLVGVGFSRKRSKAA